VTKPREFSFPLEPPPLICDLRHTYKKYHTVYKGSTHVHTHKLIRTHILNQHTCCHTCMHTLTDTWSHAHNTQHSEHSHIYSYVFSHTQNSHIHSHICAPTHEHRHTILYIFTHAYSHDNFHSITCVLISTHTHVMLTYTLTLVHGHMLLPHTQMH
jgi:hypothetical protein